MIDGSKRDSFLCQIVVKKDGKKIVCRKVLLEKNCLQRCIDKKKKVCRERFFIPPPPPLQKNNGPSLIICILFLNLARFAIVSVFFFWWQSWATCCGQEYEDCIRDIRSWMFNNNLKLNDHKTEFLVLLAIFFRTFCSVTLVTCL